MRLVATRELPRTSSPMRPLPRSFATAAPKDELEKLSPGERQRQEVIFELIESERAYVADLRMLLDLVVHPLQERHILSRYVPARRGRRHQGSLRSRRVRF